MSLVTSIITKAIIKPISISFRQLHPGDVDSLVAIEQENTEHPWSKANFVSSMADTNTLSVGLFLERDLIGYALVLVAIDSADLLNIGIHPEHKRRGFGKVLLVHMLSQLKEVSVKALILEVRAENHIAINFYKKYGFEPIAIREGYYSNLEDAKIMKLHIPNYN